MVAPSAPQRGERRAGVVSRARRGEVGRDAGEQRQPRLDERLRLVLHHGAGDAVRDPPRRAELRVEARDHHAVEEVVPGERQHGALGAQHVEQAGADAGVGAREDAGPGDLGVVAPHRVDHPRAARQAVHGQALPAAEIDALGDLEPAEGDRAEHELRGHAMCLMRCARRSRAG